MDYILGAREMALIAAVRDLFRSAKRRRFFDVMDIKTTLGILEDVCENARDYNGQTWDQNKEEPHDSH